MSNKHLHDKYGNFRAIEHQMVFRDNPDLADFLAVHMLDLFVMSDRPADQARSNKCREVLQSLGLLDYSNEDGTDPNVPTFESVKELCRRMVQ